MILKLYFLQISVCLSALAISTGLAAHPGYLLQQKHRCSLPRLLLCNAHVLLPACYVQAQHAAAPIFAKFGYANLC